MNIPEKLKNWLFGVKLSVNETEYAEAKATIERANKLVERRKELRRAYYKRHPDVVGAVNKKWRDENKDKISAYHKEYYLNHVKRKKLEQRAAATTVGVKKSEGQSGK